MSKFFMKKKKNNESEKHTKKFFRTNKILLLGTGESGKTTFIKQMKILHISGFSDDNERKEYVSPIRSNLHEILYDVLNNIKTIGLIGHDIDENLKPSVDFILKLGKHYTEFTQEYYDQVQKVWTDPRLLSTYRKTNGYQFLESAAYFLERIPDVARSDYIPNIQDILQCRVTTNTISRIEFKVNIEKKYGGGQAEFWVYDVGGQKGERKKWIQVFEGIETILFLIAASDYDQTSKDKLGQNKLEDALDLFGDIYGSRFVREAGLIVFLNKQDLLRKKIEAGKKLENYFSDFRNYNPKEKECDITNEYDRAKYFMRKKILDTAKPIKIDTVNWIPGKLVKEELPKRDIYVHFTIATDTNNIKHVFESVQEMILKKNLSDIF